MTMREKVALALMAELERQSAEKVAWHPAIISGDRKNPSCIEIDGCVDLYRFADAALVAIATAPPRDSTSPAPTPHVKKQGA